MSETTHANFFKSKANQESGLKCDFDDSGAAICFILSRFKKLKLLKKGKTALSLWLQLKISFIYFH